MFLENKQKLNTKFKSVACPRWSLVIMTLFEKKTHKRWLILSNQLMVI